MGRLLWMEWLELRWYMLGLLAGLDVPSSGSVLLQGADLFKLDEDGKPMRFE